jgi:hypothetical protein
MKQLKEELFVPIFRPSDRLVSLFVLHIEPHSGLRKLNVHEIRNVIVNILSCTLQAQAAQWQKECSGKNRYSVGTLYSGLTFPVLDSIVVALQLKKISPELSYLMFVELEQQLRDKPVILESGTLISNISEIYFFARHRTTEGSRRQP